MNILDSEILGALFRNSYLFFSFSVLIGTFFITYILIPKVLWVSKEKNLTKPIIGRSAHDREVPSFGGVAFFISFVLIISIIQSVRTGSAGNHLIAALTILFMVGLKDDLVISTARVKLWGQLIAASFIVFSPELQLTTLHGFFGIFEIPVILGYVFNAFLVVAIINAYNLIDGINGLAGVIGIIICFSYGVVFYFTDLPFFTLICGTVIGILLAFLRYNFSRGDKKIFMGDSGSLIIGLILGFLTIKILAMQPNSDLISQGYSSANRILLILAVLFIPIFDTGRVMLIRISTGRSPFSADRNHAHHVLLDHGFGHLKSSLLLGGLNLSVIALYVLFNRELSTAWLGFLILGTYASSFLLFYWARKRKPQLKQKESHPPSILQGIKLKRPQEKPLQKSKKEEPQNETFY